MGISKIDLFSKETNELADLLKALSHPARLRIVEILLNQKSCVTGSIMEDLQLAQPTVSQHLRELKEAGIIKGEIEGKSICYCIDSATWKKFEKVMLGLFQDFNNLNEKCC